MRGALAAAVGIVCGLAAGCSRWELRDPSGAKTTMLYERGEGGAEDGSATDAPPGERDEPASAAEEDGADSRG
jgi:hypothetical protein